MPTKPKTRKPQKTPTPKTTKNKIPTWLHNYLTTLTHTLHLTHWNITIDPTPCDENCWADITITPNQNTATINLAPNWHTWTPKETRDTLLHELIHCHLNQFNELTQELTDTHPETTTINKALDYTNERITDTLTNILAPHTPLPTKKSNK